VTDKLSRQWRRFIVGISGGIVLFIGIVAIPYPGPGWLIVFASLAILAKEFPWAERALKFGREKYDAWNKWIKRQSWFVKSLTFFATVIVVVLTLWLLNAYGFINHLFKLHWNWLDSPLFR